MASVCFCKENRPESLILGHDQRLYPVSEPRQVDCGGGVEGASYRTITLLLSTNMWGPIPHRYPTQSPPGILAYTSTLLPKSFTARMLHLSQLHLASTCISLRLEDPAQKPSSSCSKWEHFRLGFGVGLDHFDMFCICWTYFFVVWAGLWIPHDPRQAQDVIVFGGCACYEEELKWRYAGLVLRLDIGSLKEGQLILGPDLMSTVGGTQRRDSS